MLFARLSPVVVSFLASGMTAAFAQSPAGIVFGQVPTPAQWNNFFAMKQDVLGYKPFSANGGVLSGRTVLAPSTTMNAGLNVQIGTSPNAPVNGDVWETPSSLFAQVGGVTVDVLNPTPARMPGFSGDCSSAAGTTALSCGKTGGVPFAPSATTDTTNAGNIGTGTLPPARLPTPGSTTLGGVKSSIAPSHQFGTGIDATGTPQFAQPGLADVGGTFSGDLTGSPLSPVIALGAVTAAKMATGAALANLGYTPVNKNGDTFLGALQFTPNNGATSIANLQAWAGQIFDVTQGFGGLLVNDMCIPYQGLSAAVQAAGGGTIRVYGNQVSSCAIAISNVPVAIEGVGGEGQASLTFTTNNNAGLIVNENDSHKRVAVRKLQLYSNVPQTGSYVPALKITFPQNNAPDASVTVENFQVNSNGTGYFNAGVVCANCTHHVFSHINIQGIGLASGQSAFGGGSPTMANGIQLTGYSSNGKITDAEITNVVTGIVESGDTEGTKISNINTVSVNNGIVLDDGTSGDPTSAPFYPGPHIEGWHCDSYVQCFVTKGWGQTFLHNFNFYKRPQSTQYWTGINYANGTYGSTSAPSIFNKAALGRCAQNGTPGGATCVTLGSTANGNTVSDVEPDGMNYFVDEGSTSTNNTIADNHGFPVYNTFYTGQTSIYNAWRTNPSPYNYSRRNTPAVVGNQDLSYNPLAANSATPNVGGFNLQTFHTSNTSATTITNFLNGAQGDTILVVATDANTTIQNGANIVTTSGSNIVMVNGQSVRFVLDGTLWRQV